MNKLTLFGNLNIIIFSLLKNLLYLSQLFGKVWFGANFFLLIFSVNILHTALSQNTIGVEWQDVLRIKVVGLLFPFAAIQWRYCVPGQYCVGHDRHQNLKNWCNYLGEGIAFGKLYSCFQYYLQRWFYCRRPWPLRDMAQGAKCVRGSRLVQILWRIQPWSLHGFKAYIKY